MGSWSWPGAHCTVRAGAAGCMPVLEDVVVPTAFSLLDQDSACSHSLQIGLTWVEGRL